MLLLDHGTSDKYRDTIQKRTFFQIQLQCEVRDLLVMIFAWVDALTVSPWFDLQGYTNAQREMCIYPLLADILLFLDYYTRHKYQQTGYNVDRD